MFLPVLRVQCEDQARTDGTRFSKRMIFHLFLRKKELDDSIPENLSFHVVCT